MACCIRHAKASELPAIASLYEKARQFMRRSGNPNQWTGGYPSEEILRSDIDQGRLYVCTEDQQIIAVFCYFQGVDPTYLRIYDGAWLNDAPYGVIHRIAVSSQGKGIARRCYDWALNQCGNLRIDTHRENLPMQRSLTKYGFSRCGIIYLQNGDERIAFHKTVM